MPPLSYFTLFWGQKCFFSLSSHLIKKFPPCKNADGVEYSFFRGGEGTIKLHQHWRILFISCAIKPTPTNRKTIKIIEVKTLALLLMAVVVSWVPVSSLDLCQAEAALTSIFWSFFIIFLPAFFTFFPGSVPPRIMFEVWGWGVNVNGGHCSGGHRGRSFIECVSD